MMTIVTHVHLREGRNVTGTPPLRTRLSAARESIGLGRRTTATASRYARQESDSRHVEGRATGGMAP